MKLSPEQRELARRALKRARELGASPKETKALIEAGIVESNLTNLNHGDRDSLGYLQQRPSQGWGSPSQVRDIEYATTKFIQGAKKAKRSNMSAGELAQAVQRSAFPDRYDQHSGEADAILKGLLGDSPTGSSGGSRTVTTTTPGVDNSDARRQVLASYLLGKDRRPETLLNTISQVKELKDTPSTTTTKTVRTSSSPSPSPSGRSAKSTGIVDLGKLAKKFGLSVSEQSHFDKVDPVHAPNSWHYKDRAIDVSGDPKKMREFAKYVDTRYGGSVKELFYNAGGRSVNRKNGQRVPNNFVSGHRDHVHIAK